MFYNICWDLAVNKESIVSKLKKHGPKRVINIKLITKWISPYNRRHKIILGDRHLKSLRHYKKVKGMLFPMEKIACASVLRWEAAIVHRWAQENHEDSEGGRAPEMRW